MSKIVVGMSGGVDSSLTAALLQEQGHEVLGVHMQNWSDDAHLHGCGDWEQDRQDALTVAAKLGIPFKALNFEAEYGEKVIGYMTAEYAAGRTPNPDMLCNREIKFGLLLEWALANGYEFLATGHYARTADGRLFQGVDETKDQSYFLSQLSRRQLQHALFPLGEMRKSEVRAEAAKRGLPVADKPDSQGLCFVGKVDLPEFLKERIPAGAGQVVTANGEVVGEHDGAALYTVGQRRGVGVAAGVPMYVLKTDLQANTVTVGYDRELYAMKFETEKPHWISGRLPKSLWHGRTGKFDVGIRYRMDPAAAAVVATKTGLQITFDEEQRGITPGQFAVIYKGEEVIGSAVIK